jgi:hypothetical protein
MPCQDGARHDAYETFVKRDGGNSGENMDSARRLANRNTGIGFEEVFLCGAVWKTKILENLYKLFGVVGADCHGNINVACVSRVAMKAHRISPDDQEFNAPCVEKIQKLLEMFVQHIFPLGLSG